MRIDFHARGIHLADIDLWLDPAESVATAWLSHAHSDHARGGHAHAIGTSETLALYRMRRGEVLSPEANLQELRYGETIHWRDARLTAYPASHIVGAAQLLIEWRDERVVYTGDIKLRAPICGALTEVVPCTRLIIESTFALPIYRFVSAEEGKRRMVNFARECLEMGVTPVLLGYPLGRGQETAHALCEAGIPTAVHGSIARFIPMYESQGYSFPGWEPYANRVPGDKALVVVPGFRNYLQASGRPIRIGYVSGWAALANARARTGAEELIPYSDHADFFELLEIVERGGARELDIVHGYAEPFARLLCQRGYDARAPHATSGRDSHSLEESGTEGVEG
jgi:Cft2 family RNA processing exonuclease